MNKEIIQSDIIVMGMVVPSFPDGIGEAFEKLQDMLPDGQARTFYGITDCTGNGVTYRSAALQTFGGEAEKYGLETYTIAKGEYLSETVTDWHNHTGNIKGVFAELCRHEHTDCDSPMIEIYKNVHEMVCLVKLDTRKYLARSFEKSTQQLIEVISSVNEEEMNRKPAFGGWTVAQVAEHMRKSDSGILQIMKGPVRKTERDPSEWMEAIKKDFLDFDAKNKSPEFVVPEDKTYEKSRLINGLNRRAADIIAVITTLPAEETCVTLSFPVYGELTRMELAQFMIYHTQRHTRQAKKIAEAVTGNA